MPRKTQSADDLTAMLRSVAVQASTIMRKLAWHERINFDDRAALFDAVLAIEAAIELADARPRRKRTVKIKEVAT